jgi:MYXO-CTERM domain-containing protein
VHPGAPEICDALHSDEDCDGLADDADSSVDPSTFGTWYADSDGDGYGNPGQSRAACEGVAGELADASDCDDTRNDIHPGATETDCSDPTDYNCDGSVGFADADTDGTPACQDCNDADGAIHPGAQEVCDAANTDEDCDGLADDADSSVDPSGFSSGYTDGDGDGYGAGTPVSACDLGEVVADGSDCDDRRGDIHPQATEDDCTDPTDYNCDGSVGYADADGDGSAACLDCNDNDGAISPTESERCNQVDDNCDGTVDEGNICDSTGGQDSDSGTGKDGTCGCSTHSDPGGGAGLAVLLAGLAWRRRRS